MSWIKRAITPNKQSDGMGRSAVATSSSSPSGTPRSSRSSSTSSHGLQQQQQPQQPPPSSPARPRSNTDPQTCLVVFKSHWSQAAAIISRNGATSTPVRRSLNEEVDAVIQYADQMMRLMVEEEEDHGGQGPILQFLLEEDILTQLLTWSSQAGSEHVDRLRLHQLAMFDTLISQSRQPLFVHKPLIRPLLKLLSSCEDPRNPTLETRLILLLHQLCVNVTQNTQMLELLFSASTDQGPAKFVIFSLLIPYIHREGQIGQQARDALLLIMSLSCVHDHIGIYIADNSDFCPVLATGLSGLYSSLPRKLDGISDDWHQLTETDIHRIPELTMFLNSLDFCNAVVQVAHPALRDQLLLFVHQGFLRPQLEPDLFQVSHGLVRQQLVEFIYNGFLVPVIGPALHQNEILYSDPPTDTDGFGDYLFFNDDNVDIFKLPMSLVENYFASSMDEVIAATAYLDLFIRRVTEPALIRTFLKFILTEKHDDKPILTSLIERINSHSRLCMVTLSLFETLISLSCEDVMYQLIFKYLIPCTHVMVSQRRAVKDVDLYSKTAEKLLTLKPAACTSDYTETPDTSATNTPAGSQAASANLLAANYMHRLSRAPSVAWRWYGGAASSSSPTNTPISARKRLAFWKPRERTQSVDVSVHSMYSQATPDHFSATAPTFGSRLEHYETNYMDYLRSVRPQILHCVRACHCWSAPYDGENPSPDSLFATEKEAKLLDEQTASSQSEPSTQTADQSEGSTQNLGAMNGEAASTSSQSGVDLKTGDSSKVSASGKVSGQKEAYAESIVSEADSALSGSSNNTDSLHHTTSDFANPSSRTDSPLNDNFDNADFAGFLATLQRVKTPVEFSESFEQCLKEIDVVAEKVKLVHVTPRRTASSSSNCDLQNSSSATTSTSASTDPPSSSSSDISKPTSPAVDTRNRTSTEGSLGDMDSKLTRFDSLLNLESGGAGGGGSSWRLSGTGDGDGTPTTTSSSSSAFTAVKGGGAGTVFTPTKYNLGKPDIGPFLSTLLNKLEAMMQNSLYVNLLLTGLVTRLACYPQPLLRSFLLNHTLVFQPTVKSLVQVLGAVKHKVDCYSYQVKEFDALLLKARKFMAWREENQRGSGMEGRPRAESMLQATPAGGRSRQGSLAELHRDKKRGGSISEFFRRNTPGRSSMPATSRLHMLGDRKGFRYINRQQQQAATPSKVDAKQQQANDLETLKTKNAVYCALVLEEFVKELAAISQEHAVAAGGL